MTFKLYLIVFFVLCLIAGTFFTDSEDRGYCVIFALFWPITLPIGLLFLAGFLVLQLGKLLRYLLVVIFENVCDLIFSDKKDKLP